MDGWQGEAGPRHLARAAAWLRSLPVVAQDSLLALVLAAALLTDLARSDAGGDTFREPDALGAALVALLVLPLALRRRYPLTVFALVLVDAVVVIALLYRPSSYGFGLIIATYSVARWCDRRISVVALILGQAFPVYAKLRAMAVGIEIEWFAWPLDAVYFAAAWFLGYSIRTRQQYAAALEHSREALAERAIEHERNHIARELHDSVGQAISVMLLHTGAAAQMIDRDPERAAAALSSAGDVGRAALSEMDHMLGVLRTHDHEANLVLRPSMINLAALVDEYRALGLDITTAVEQPPAPLPTAVDRSAFRIIQEALTNTLKHAGPTRTEVTVAYADATMMLEIRDHGQPQRRSEPTAHGGRGITGMRERTTLLHGHLVAGPCDDTGFRVAAQLPLDVAGTS